MCVHTWDRSFDALDSFIMVRWGSNPRLPSCRRPCSTKRLCSNSATHTHIHKTSKPPKLIQETIVLIRPKRKAVSWHNADRRDVTEVMWWIQTYSITGMLYIHLYFLPMNHLKIHFIYFCKRQNWGHRWRRVWDKRWRKRFLLAYRLTPQKKTEWTNARADTHGQRRTHHLMRLRGKPLRVFLEEELYIEGKVST